MKLLFLFVILSIISFKKCDNNILKSIKNKKNKTIFYKSKNLQRNLDKPEILQLILHLDLLNFNRTIPDSLKAYKDIIINSMKRPKKILESLLKVNFYVSQSDISYEDFLLWGINEYDESLIIKYEDYINEEKVEKIRFNIDENNHYIILFKFSDDAFTEDDIASAEISYGLDRPLIGIITFKKEIPISKLNEKYLEPLMLHLFTHLLGFQENEQHNLESLGTIIEKDTGLSKYFVVSEKVIEYAKKYFGDGNIDKIEILKDEKGNLHWPSRILLGDYMTKFNYPEELSISGFTLAFLEDLGHYEIENYYTGGLMRFGKNKGSDFLNKKCEKDGVQFKNEFYYPTSDLTIMDPSCSSGRQSKTEYKLISYKNADGTTSSIPVDYQYFNEDVTMGGFESADYCPISQSYSEIKLNDLCSETTNTANNIIGESFSSNSFCALTSLIKKSTPNYETYLNKVQSGCFEMFCSKLSLTIKIGEEYFVCPRSGGKINGNEDFEGYFLCPDYNLICTGEYMCNNMFDCVEKKSKENEESFKYDGENGYTIKTTQISSEYTDINLSPIIRAWELSEDNDGKCPYFCSQCNLNGECTRCGTNYKIVNNICEEKVENCEEYNSNEECQTCKTNYVFVDGNKNKCLEKSELDSQKYFQDPVDSNNYIACSTAIQNCEKCTDSTHCTKCKTNFGIINDNSAECIDLSSNEYYLDSDGKYKLCSSLPDLGSCQKCLKDSDNINCIECTNNNYALVHRDIDKCILKTDIENQDYDDMFTIDNGLNYYLCSNNLYHSVENCLKCSNKDLCNACKKDYERANSNTLCLSKNDLLSQKYYMDPTDNNYYLCSEIIKGCNKCSDGNTCIVCNNEFNLDENNKCIHVSITMLRYYLDPNTGKYKSCSIIQNCEECSSEKECTKCENGYMLNKDSLICEKIKTNDNKDYSVLAKAAISLSVIAIASSIAIIIFIFLKKFIFNGRPLVNNEIIPQKSENDVDNANKRSIHNEVKINE